MLHLLTLNEPKVIDVKNAIKPKILNTCCAYESLRIYMCV
uniref:Uncharacterized protein n=1 Tax=Ciona intestinalis TaxID=7719 RepID=H2Y3N2_CIOIN